jgi:hypothetical protein
MQTTDLLAHYDVEDKRLIPLFEQPCDWFQDYAPDEHYETAAGPFVQLTELTPTAAVFTRSESCSGDPETYDMYTTRLESLVAEHNDVTGENVTVVAGREEGESVDDSPSIWVKTEGRTFVYIYERVPFETRVKSLNDLKTTLATVMGDSVTDYIESRVSELESVTG